MFFPFSLINLVVMVSLTFLVVFEPLDMTTSIVELAYSLIHLDASFALITTLMLSLLCILGLSSSLYAPSTFDQLRLPIALDDDEPLLPLLILLVSSLRNLVDMIQYTTYILVNHDMVDGIPL